MKNQQTPSNPQKNTPQQPAKNNPADKPKNPERADNERSQNQRPNQR